MSNTTAASGNGTIYSNGYAMSQNAALKQNEMNNAIGGRGKRGRGKKGRGKRGTGKRGRQMYNGGGETVVQPVHASYPNNGIQGLNADLTRVTAQQQANAQYDGNAAKGGSIRRKTNRRKTNRRRTNRRKTNRRKTKSRRHM